MDIEQLLYEAGRLHDAVCLMNRISRALNAIFSAALGPAVRGARLSGST